MKPTWHDFLKVAASEKKANWLTDTLIVNPITSFFRRQNETYRAEQAARAAQAKAQASAVKPKPVIQNTVPDRTDALTRIAQGVSDTSKPYSIAKHKVYSGGQVVAR